MPICRVPIPTGVHPLPSSLLDVEAGIVMWYGNQRPGPSGQQGIREDTTHEGGTACRSMN